MGSFARGQCTDLKFTWREPTFGEIQKNDCLWLCVESMCFKLSNQSNKQQPQVNISKKYCTSNGHTFSADKLIELMKRRTCVHMLQPHRAMRWATEEEEMCTKTHTYSRACIWAAYRFLFTHTTVVFSSFAVLTLCFCRCFYCCRCSPPHTNEWMIEKTMIAHSKRICIWLPSCRVNANDKQINQRKKQPNEIYVS